jgi:hypothetical protein
MVVFSYYAAPLVPLRFRDFVDDWRLVSFTAFRLFGFDPEISWCLKILVPFLTAPPVCSALSRDFVMLEDLCSFSLRRRSVCSAWVSRFQLEDLFRSFHCAALFVRFESEISWCLDLLFLSLRRSTVRLESRDFVMLKTLVSFSLRCPFVRLWFESSWCSGRLRSFTAPLRLFALISRVRDARRTRSLSYCVAVLCSPCLWVVCLQDRTQIPSTIQSCRCCLCITMFDSFFFNRLRLWF